MRKMIYAYKWTLPQLMPESVDGIVCIVAYPMGAHAWDNTPRSRTRGIVLHESTPGLGLWLPEHDEDPTP